MIKHSCILGNIIFMLASLNAAPLPVKDEPLLFTGETKAEATAHLLHVPLAAPQLAAANGTATYEAGKDYTWEAGSRMVKLTADSRIPFKTNTELHPAPNSPHSYKCQRGTEAWMFYGPNGLMHSLQCTAAYASEDGWAPPLTKPAPAEQLGAWRQKLPTHAPLKLVMLGDSISTGADASALAGQEPKQLGYPDLVAKGLETRTGAKVTLKNLSVGGMDVAWGLTQVPAVLAEKPDVLMIAFGMNDASAHRTAAELARITQEIFTKVRVEFPDCIVVVITPMTANAEWIHSAPELYPAYAKELATLVGPSVCCADVTPVWTAVAERKRYLDLSGNGLNHPNDYGHRLYAEVVLTTLLE
jgi:acyl-CoA thioesterase I